MDSDNLCKHVCEERVECQTNHFFIACWALTLKWVIQWFKMQILHSLEQSCHQCNIPCLPKYMQSKVCVSGASWSTEHRLPLEKDYSPNINCKQWLNKTSIHVMSCHLEWFCLLLLLLLWEFILDSIWFSSKFDEIRWAQCFVVVEQYKQQPWPIKHAKVSVAGSGEDGAVRRSSAVSGSPKCTQKTQITQKKDCVPI